MQQGQEKRAKRVKRKKRGFTSLLEPAIDSLELLVLLLVRVLDEVVHVRVEEQKVVVPAHKKKNNMVILCVAEPQHTQHRQRERGVLSVVGAELLLVVLPVEVVDRYNNVVTEDVSNG
jgi:hypothetical protein